MHNDKHTRYLLSNGNDSRRRLMLEEETSYPLADNYHYQTSTLLRCQAARQVPSQETGE